ncbi:MAG: response regulator [Firmicutes bacterium]|nr:response regulator [Bacillota bacterium]
MKILVVDDEQVMLDSIHRILDREPDILLETARTGREAIDKVQTFHPDLVMMDIKMPGINGLEALNEIRRLDQNVVLVILSAYDNFNYAQEAIKNDVFEYLLKPITKTRIVELIRKVQHHMEKRHFSRLKELEIREKYQKSLPIIENEFIHALIRGVDETGCMEYQELLGVQFQAGFFVVVSYLTEIDSIDGNIELQYQSRSRIAALAEEIRHLFPCFVGLNRTNPIAIFIPVFNYLGSNQQAMRELQEGYLLKIMQRLETYKLPIKFRVGVGSIYTHPLEYRKSYHEALQALDSYTQSDLCYFSDIEFHPQYNWEPEFEGYMEEILEGVRFGHLKRVEILCQNLSSKFIVKSNLERDRLLCYLLELILSAYRVSKKAIKSKDFSEHFPLGYQELSKILDCSTDLEDLFDVIKVRILNLTDYVRNSLEGHIKDSILKAKEIIDRNYHQNLSLEEIARSVSISPFYFCRLFREELGVSFSEYLTKVRMEKAVDLLAQGLSVKECCFALGYNDPNYFSRIFRKYYQVSPSEYRGELVKKERRNNENED